MIKIFVQSLHQNSYFQLIGFGSNFRAYSNKPEEYNMNNIKKTLSESINSLLEIKVI